MEKIEGMSHAYTLAEPYVVSVEEMDGKFPVKFYQQIWFS